MAGRYLKLVAQIVPNDRASGVIRENRKYQILRVSGKYQVFSNEWKVMCIGASLKQLSTPGTIILQVAWKRETDWRKVEDSPVVTSQGRVARASRRLRAVGST